MDFVDCPGQDGASALYREQSHYQQQLYPYNDPHATAARDVKLEGHAPSLSMGTGCVQSAQQVTLPKVGQTRCYWALLTSSLQFLVLDPVLAYHLNEQATDFLKTSLLDFVHPEERASAHQDLGGVLEERTLHGSVTRVRYCRLSRVRRMLGFMPSATSPPYPPTFPAERIAIDTNYMAVDIVINWVAEGLVLCFIHAVVDIAPREDNDELYKTGWTNWCSTYGFDEEQAHSMYQRLCEFAIPSQPIPRQSPDSSLRVLQILRNQPDRPLMLSWPPDSSSVRSHYITPSAQELARLAQHVQIGTALGVVDSNEARTSCTRRYKSMQNVYVPTPEGSKAIQVESIFIPHGTIIFACHKIDGMYYSPSQFASGGLVQQLQSGLVCSYMPAEDHQQVPYNSAEPSYGLHYVANPSPHQIESQAYVQQWVEGLSQPQDYLPEQLRQTPSPRQSSGSHSRSGSGSTGVTNTSHHYQWPNQANAFLGASAPTFLGAETNQLRAQSPTRVHDISPLASSCVTLPAGSAAGSAEGGSPAANSDSHIQDRQSPSAPSHNGSSREQYSGGGRSAGNPPVGVMRCASCKATHSPEWRKGPSGKKDLCNACGLRFARSRAKKEGVTARKRKEKERGTPPRQTPSITMSGSFTASSSNSPAPGRSLIPSQKPIERGDSPESLEKPPGTSSLSFEQPGTTLHGPNSQFYPRNGNMQGHSITPSPSPPIATFQDKLWPQAAHRTDELRESSRPISKTFAPGSANLTVAQPTPRSAYPNVQHEQHDYYVQAERHGTLSTPHMVKEDAPASLFDARPDSARQRGDQHDRMRGKGGDCARKEDPLQLPLIPVPVDGRYLTQPSAWCEDGR